MLETIRQFLATQRFAMVGVSHTSSEFSRVLWREFLEREYDVVPVNPAAGEIDGRRCYARVQDIDPPVKAALLLTAPAVTGKVVRDCAEAGVQLVWMYRAGGAGAVSAPAAAFCQEHGIVVIPGECPLMFLEDTGWIHRAHGWVRRMCRTFPG
jgi:predicted CoA-binding protein